MKHALLLGTLLEVWSYLAAAVPVALLGERALLAEEPEEENRGAGKDSEDDESDAGQRHFVRPHFGKGEPEVVKFGIYAKQIVDIDLVKGTFNADIVVTLRWQDPAAAAIPKQLNANLVTLPTQAAKKKMWLPKVGISNRDLYGVDIISSAISVDSHGNVEKVERILSDMHSTFFTACFPFDTQEVYVRLASTSLMADELVFEPLEEDHASGVMEGALNSSNFVLDSWSIGVITETDASLSKSRGQLLVKVSRLSMPHIQSLLLPELLVLAISCSVFWLPPLAAFVMPRVATALISFLTLTTLGLRTNSMIPIRGGLAWIDLFENSCQSIVLFALLLNILVLVVFHSFKEEAIGYRMDAELSCGFPAVAVSIFTVVFCNRDGEHLALMSLCNSLACGGGSLLYLVYTIWRVRDSMHKKKVAEPMA